MIDRPDITPRVTITCLGRFHAFDLAEQLHKQGVLERIITVYPKSFLKKWNIPSHKICSLLPLGIIWRLTWHLPKFMRKKYIRLALYMYDITALFFIPKQSNIVVGWSSCALHIIRRAKKYGAKTVLERGSAHIVEQNRLLVEEARLQKSLSPSLAEPWSIKQELKEYEEADYISIPSNFAKRSFLKHGILEKKLLVNPYGVNLNDFYPMKKEDNVFRIVHCGAISMQKGIPYLLQAFSELNLPNSELWLIGRIEKEMKAVLKKFSSPNIIAKGTFPQKELYKLYNQCSVFCLCSIQDGFAMVIPQAMACQLPVIVTENTAGEDIVKNGNNGFVIKIRDVEELKEKLKFLHSHPEECRRMGLQAAESVKRGFAWSDYGSRMVEHYKNILISHKTI